MPQFVLHHRHETQECAASFAAWRGFKSPLRGRSTVGSCALGGHEIWWRVEAENEAAALGNLPRYVAERTSAHQVAEVEIP
jgi:hypothetical protein